MQIDLDHPDARSLTQPVRSQVCIIGAGIAGLTLAHRLVQQGIDITLLEAGGPSLEPEGQQLLTEAHLLNHPHAGTHAGRFRAFGGASLRWGGQILPLPLDLIPEYPSSRPESAPTVVPVGQSLPERGGYADAAVRPLYFADAAWPISPQTLTPFQTAAETLLGVDHLPYSASAFFTTNPPPLTQLPHLEARLSKWAPFPRRNLAQTLGRDLLASPRAQVFLHAQATELLLASNRSHLTAVLVRTRAGHTFRFEAGHFVLAAGTVETCRLLLASRSIAPEGVGNTHDQVGRNFHDHLTLPAATFNGPARAAILRQARPWVLGDTLHSLKLEAAPELRAQLHLHPVLAHVTLTEPEDSGLALVRDLLTARQRGDLAATLRSQARGLPAAALEALRLAWEAKIHHRRFVSPQTTVRLQLNTAQDTPSTSRITLSEDLDPFGLPQPQVDWRITPNELTTLRTFAAHLRDSLRPLGPIDWVPELFTPDAPLPNLEDARHAMGGAIMGLDPRTSVVDPNLTMHNLPNLHIASPATFPSGTSQLPTLPLMTLALRLAGHLASQPITNNQ